MALNSFFKTRWKIEQDRVSLYPFGLFYILSAILGVIFAGIWLLYVKYQDTSPLDSGSFALFLLLIVILVWAYGNTYIQFDNSKAVMQKKLFGFITSNSIPFINLQGINLVNNLGGGYNYRLFRKDTRYGVGIIVSSGYSKNDDPNAIAFVDEAVPIIHAYLDQHDIVPMEVEKPVTSYRFFDNNAGIFTLRNPKVGTTIWGSGFILLGLWLTTIETNGILAKIVMVIVMILIGLVFINAAFTKIIFDTINQTVVRRGLVRFGNKQYNFGDFAGIQTIRHSLNFVYMRTSINMYFNVTGTNKQEVFTVVAVRKSQDIERFIKELYQILEYKL